MNTTKLDSHSAVAGQVERGVRPAVPTREIVERLATWLDAAAWQNKETSFHEYEQAAEALRALQAELDNAASVERERCAALVESYKQTPGLAGWGQWPQQIALVIRASGPNVNSRTPPV